MHGRYSRQRALLGEAGQQTLEEKKVVIVGVGALGSVAAELLVRAGIGKILLIDRDVVEESNLQRQMLFAEEDVGRSKALAAKEKLLKINSAAEIKAQAIHLNSENIGLLQHGDLILDGTDNLATRFLINDFCKKNCRPWIYAAAIRTAGYVMPIVPDGPCLRCFLHEAQLETCETAGVINTITTSIAALQVTLALQLLLGEKVEPGLRYYDVWKGTLEEIKIPKNESCPACQGRFEYLTKGDPLSVVKFCGAERFEVRGKKIDWKELKRRWEPIQKVQEDAVSLRFRNLTLFADGRCLIKAKSKEEALAAYDCWVGR